MKLFVKINFLWNILININIGCIETRLVGKNQQQTTPININMGCIETVTTERILEPSLKDQY